MHAPGVGIHAEVAAENSRAVMWEPGYSKEMCKLGFLDFQGLRDLVRCLSNTEPPLVGIHFSLSVHVSSLQHIPSSKRSGREVTPYRA